MTAKALIRQARQVGQAVPIVFASATDTRNVFAAGELVAIKTGKSNAYVVENVRLLDHEIPKTRLQKISDGRRLSTTYQRDYAICRTPELRFAALTKAPTKVDVLRGNQDALEDHDSGPVGSYRQKLVTA